MQQNSPIQRRPLAYHAMDGLALSSVPLHAIADALGTPVWVFSADALRSRVTALRQALSGAGLAAHVHYAVKANDHLAILRTLAEQRIGADVVSEGELRRALLAGIAPQAIVFSGVGKTDAELRLALDQDISQINVESAEELDRIAAIANAAGRTARVAPRVNPDVDAETHAKISTGRAGDKFGIPLPEAARLYRQAGRIKGLRPVGLAVHIGSQITTMGPYRAAYARVAALIAELRADGETVTTLDAGGGLAIPYRDEPTPPPEAWAGAIAGAFKNADLRIIVEPGRWLVGPCGVLLASVIQIKETAAERFVILDAALTELMRPALYDAYHEIVPLDSLDALRPAQPAHVVGPVCESSDIFARDRPLPPLKPASRVAILDAGAYGAVMSSTYNARPLAPIALIDRGRWSVIRRRQPIEALWEHEIVAE